MTDLSSPGSFRPGHRPKLSAATSVQAIAAQPAGSRQAPDAARFAISPPIAAGLLRLAEFGLVIALGAIFFLSYVDEPAITLLDQYLAPLLIAGVATGMGFQALDLYNLPALRTIWRQVPRIWLGWSITFAVLMATAFLFKVGAEYSRGWLILWYLGGFAGLVASRGVLSHVIAGWMRDGRLERRAVIVGGGPAAAELIAEIEADADNDIRIYGIFDDRGGERGTPMVAGYPKLGNVNELIDYARINRVDLLIVSLPLTAENRLLQILSKLWVLPVDIRLSAHTSRLRFRPRTYSYIGRVATLPLFDKPIAHWDFVAKWVFDKVIASFAILALSPVMLLTALAIKFDSKGPVIFKQKRFGFNNELIEVYKFRSMYTDMADANAAKLVTKDDPRVTPVGRIIRKTSLDELPQLFNVLKGQLSLVGPRPHAMQAKAADALYNDVVDGYFARHRVKPGITGWAQINGWRGETDTADKIQKRVECDLHYIENWSVLFDLYILLRTPFALLKSENAY